MGSQAELLHHELLTSKALWVDVSTAMHNPVLLKELEDIVGPLSENERQFFYEDLKRLYRRLLNKFHEQDKFMTAPKKGLRSVVARMIRRLEKIVVKLENLLNNKSFRNSGAVSFEQKLRICGKNPFLSMDRLEKAVETKTIPELIEQFNRNIRELNEVKSKFKIIEREMVGGLYSIFWIYTKKRPTRYFIEHKTGVDGGETGPFYSFVKKFHETISEELGCGYEKVPTALVIKALSERRMDKEYKDLRLGRTSSLFS